MPTSEAPSSAAAIIPELAPDPVAAVRAGLPYASLEHVRGLQGDEDRGTPDALLARILGISPRTLNCRREAGALTADASARPGILAEIIAVTWKALGSASAAHRWSHALQSMLSSFDAGGLSSITWTP